jgi:hypothetical protein
MSEIVAIAPKTSAHHFSALMKRSDLSISVLENYDVDAVVQRKPSVVVAIDDFHLLNVNALAQMRHHNIGVLLMFDGILEWRRTFEYPLECEHLPFEQPVGAHKIACLGASQARLLESWGNMGKCEIVGVPRFDRLAQNRPPLPPSPPLRVLVMTAKTPGFNESQFEACRQSLEDLRKDAAKMDNVELVWRVSPKIRAALGLEDRTVDTKGADLHEQLAGVHAVVTTMSTAYLESLLAGRPTAVLDYTNSPHFISPAWRICCRDHITSVLRELMNPATEKMAYQEFVLRDSLYLEEPATERLARLLASMVHQVGANPPGTPLRFPDRMLPVHSAGTWDNIDWQRYYAAYPHLSPDSTIPTKRDYQSAVSSAAYWEKKHREYVQRLDCIPVFGRLKRLGGRLLGVHRKSVYRAS